MKKGINASPGIAIARAIVYVKQELTVVQQSIDDVQAELDRFNAAVAKSKDQLNTLKEKTASEMSEEEAAIFDAHSMFLEDPEFVGAITQSIENDKINAEAATKAVVDQFYAMFDAMDDPYFKGRAADIQDVGDRLLRNLMGIEIMDISHLDEDAVIVAEDLAPSDTATMDKVHVKGFATDIGSRTSHTAIMARSLEIPAILGLQDITKTAKTGEIIIVDGSTGEAIVDPTDEELAEYKEKQKAFEAYMAELAELKDQDAETTDGHKVKVVANIGSPKDVEGVVRNGGKGVGLYRSEFLYMNSDEMPTEDKQFAAYKTVIEQFKDGEGVIIRTLDIGGDKKLPYLPLEEEMNPFLGLRAIRLCLSKPDMFKTQLRAILRASAFGKTRVMFPMIGNVDEVRQAKAILKECMQELDAEGVDYDHDLETGIMVEIPSAAITADIIADEVDFFSIGTNDLCQYTLAVDRMNQNVSYLYDPLHPAILRLVKNVITQSHNKPGKFTGMCGEMAGDPVAALILLGLGLDEFSMSASSIPQVKKIIRSVSFEQAKAVADKAMTMQTGTEIRQYVQDTLKELGIQTM
ncbi:MAG: phosphoenolpyruvate--protein phosphotransferase [Eubacteriaceae bacterium]|uniref:Phosphoenolpyruvate-protein phosphotransferase n=1 Tax=Candidatus Pseudoramibacter fermentans TaxID=2594427 RepID=A0A6L5GSZ8_9FIRM|nr:phosphoenolpyruvate--protein phosphotransferase [Candidatus Pseudoramibacter fermentans]RRF93457.1 MAG: phosphoenolpyruvate--protein phosphotransferase [Eubacteriaceae bacterium]